MTLDEAIKQFESVKLYKNFEEFVEDCGDSRVKEGIKICGNPVNSLLFRGYGICDEDHCPDYKKCVERAEEHRQLAEWLRELLLIKQTREKLNENFKNDDVIICPRCGEKVALDTTSDYKRFSYYCPHCGIKM